MRTPAGRRPSRSTRRSHGPTIFGPANSRGVIIQQQCWVRRTARFAFPNRPFGPLPILTGQKYEVAGVWKPPRGTGDNARPIELHQWPLFQHHNESHGRPEDGIQHRPEKHLLPCPAASVNSQNVYNHRRIGLQSDSTQSSLCAGTMERPWGF